MNGSSQCWYLVFLNQFNWWLNCVTSANSSICSSQRCSCDSITAPEVKIQIFPVLDFVFFILSNKLSCKILHIVGSRSCPDVLCRIDTSCLLWATCTETRIHLICCCMPFFSSIIPGLVSSIFQSDKFVNIDYKKGLCPRISNSRNVVPDCAWKYTLCLYFFALVFASIFVSNSFVIKNNVE